MSGSRQSSMAVGGAYDCLYQLVMLQPSETVRQLVRAPCYQSDFPTPFLCVMQSFSYAVIKKASAIIKVTKEKERERRQKGLSYYSVQLEELCSGTEQGRSELCQKLGHQMETGNAQGRRGGNCNKKKRQKKQERKKRDLSYEAGRGDLQSPDKGQSLSWKATTAGKDKT